MQIIRLKYKIYVVVLIVLLILVFMAGCEKNFPITYPDYTGGRGIFYDIEGNKYKTIGIGSQIWMAENLRSTRLNDNTEIKYLKDSVDWTSGSEPGYCWYDNDTLLKIPYGGLYNWHAVNTEKLCPTGWHIPSELEWRALIGWLGGERVAEGQLKVIGHSYWKYPNPNATNSACFNAIPGGGVFYGQFLDFGKWCHWWSGTQRNEKSATRISLSYRSSFVTIGGSGEMNPGLSVRCIKNNTAE
jgi:uncharacterized protein (TIGR02145 family)